ncbi:MAG: DUF1294 domain-containing protein [Limnohabitans sp.]|nr:DUF1294 domain-containing protein [Limnohabitans sp.]
MKVIILYLIIINGINFVVFGIDKFLAIKSKRRVPEKDLLVLSFLGGAVGGLLAMLMFKHKVAKGSFLFKFLFVLVATVFIIYFLLK